MHHLLSKHATTITELKANPTAVIESAKEEAIVVLNRNTPTAYILTPKMFEMLLDALDDLELSKTVIARKKDLSKAVKVDLDDL
jgi:antitoxin StbD